MEVDKRRDGRNIRLLSGFGTPGGGAYKRWNDWQARQGRQPFVLGDVASLGWDDDLRVMDIDSLPEKGVPDERR